MLNMRDYAAPETLQEAWDIYNSSPSNTILGGCAYLRLGEKRIGTGIDLSGLGLDHIEAHKNYIQIGAMTTLRELEINPLLKTHFGDMLSDSVKNIVGVSFRNGATVGGSVFGRYGFSDVITAFLALNADVVLYKGGQMTLERFLNEPPHYDILTSIRVPKLESKGVYQAFRHSTGDYPILTAGVCKSEIGVRISVGARPMRAALALKAMDYMNTLLGSGKEITETAIGAAADMASQELVFGTNMRAGAAYRKHLCKVLVARGLEEVL